MSFSPNNITRTKDIDIRIYETRLTKFLLILMRSPTSRLPIHISLHTTRVCTPSSIRLRTITRYTSMPTSISVHKLRSTFAR